MNAGQFLVHHQSQREPRVGSWLVFQIPGPCLFLAGGLYLLSCGIKVHGAAAASVH
jgi:hypothetical protein